MEADVMNRSSHGWKKSETCVSALSFIVLLFTAVLPPEGMGEDSADPERIAWTWSKSELSGLDFLASQMKRDAGGYWVHKVNRFSVRSNISAGLTAEAGRYLERLLVVIPRVFGFPVLEEKQMLVLTIHKTAADFEAAAGKPPESRASHKITGTGGSTAEVNICAVDAETDGKLVNTVNLRSFQCETVRALLELAARGRELSIFVSDGCAAYMESWNPREEAPQWKPRMAENARLNRLKALQDAVMETGAYCPDLLENFVLQGSSFSGDNALLKLALGESFADFLFSSRQRVRMLPALLYRDTGSPADMAARFADLKTLMDIEQQWHDHICRVVSELIYVQIIEIPVTGTPAGIPAASRADRYGTIPLISVYPGPDDTYDIGWFAGSTKSIRVLKCGGDNSKKAEISPAFLDGTSALLGFCSIPGKDLYFAGHSKDNESGNRNCEFWVAGFNGTGKELFDTRLFGEKNSEEVHSKGYPGTAGSSRLIYNEAAGNIGVYCSHTMKWPDNVRHQAGFISLLTPAGKDRTVNGWYVSHNFDQRMVVKDGDFYMLAHGDAYPRALVLSKWNAGGKCLFQCNYHDIPGESGDNTTNCQTGGLVVLDDKRIILIFASSNGRKSHDVCVKVFDVAGKETNEKWLTSYAPGVNGYFPRIAAYGKDVFVAWEESSGQGSWMRYAVIDGSLETLKKQTPVLGVHVPSCYDMVNLSGGAIAWAVPGTRDSVRVYRIDLPEKQYAVLADKLSKETARLAKSSYAPKKEIVEKIDEVLLKKLVKLGSEGTMPKKGMILSKSKASVTIVAAGEDGSLKFEAQSGTARKSASFSLKELDFPDKAVIAAAVASQEPDNKPLCGVTAFYMQCAGQKNQARMYFALAGSAEAQKFRRFFQEN